VLTVEQGLLAAHGVLPVCECPGTTGVPGLNDHTINGQGSAACSCPRAFVPAGGGTLEFGATCPPSALIIGAFAGSCAPGAATIDPSVPYTLDLDPFSLGFLFDGTGWLLPPGPLTPFFKSDPAGNFSLALTATLPPGPLFVSQFAFVHPAFPLGIGTSQAIEIVASDDPCLVGTDLGLGDDTSAAIALGVPVTYYGHTYAEIFVNANGNLTFCAGDSDFTASVGEFLGTSSVLSGLPRIAPAWRDWSPNIAGSVMAFNGPSRFGVCYERVPSFGCGVDDPNTFVVTIDKLSDEITFCYGVMSLCGGTELDNIIVGLSPGFDIAGLCPPGPLTPVASTSTNLYPATPAGVGPYGALFELFSPGTTIDFPVGHLEVFVPIPGPTYSNVTP
jgi:hypothetical protein